MKTTLAQVGNSSDSGFGAILVKCVALGENLPVGYPVVFVYWCPDANDYYIGLCGTSTNSAIFKEAEFYCTCSMRPNEFPKDFAGLGGGRISSQTVAKACEQLGKPAFLCVEKDPR